MISFLFKQSAPECSLLSPSLHRHSQSVMPNSCQVSETESPSSLFDGEILAQIFSKRNPFFKFFSCNFPIIWYNVLVTSLAQQQGAKTGRSKFYLRRTVLAPWDGRNAHQPQTGAGGLPTADSLRSRRGAESQWDSFSTDRSRA